MQIRFDFLCSLGDRLRQFAIYNQDIDRFFRQKRTNFTVELNRILSQFLHICQNRNSASCRQGRKHTYRRFHRIRACIVGIVHDRITIFMINLLTVLEPAKFKQLFRCIGKRHTVGIRNRQGSQRIHDIVLAHNSQLHRDAHLAVYHRKGRKSIRI